MYKLRLYLYTLLWAVAFVAPATAAKVGALFCAPTGCGALTARPVPIPMNQVTPDGVGCFSSLDQVLGDFPVTVLECIDNDDSPASPAYITGQWRSDDDWDGSALKFELGLIYTGVDAPEISLDVSAKCCQSGTLVDDSLGATVELALDPLTGGDAWDAILSGSVTPAGICDGGALVLWKIQLDEETSDADHTKTFYNMVTIIPQP